MGGVRRHNAELLPRAAKLLAEDAGELVIMEGRDPIAFELPPEVRRLQTNVPASPPAVRASFEGRALRKLLAEEAQAGRPIDLVHLAHLPAPRSLPIPHTHTIHDLRALHGAHSPMSRRLVSRHIIGAAVRSAAHTITVSELVKGQLVESFQVDADRVHVIPNGCDHLPLLPRADAAHPADAERDRAPLLCVGHLEPRKNISLLIEALALDATLGDLVLVGSPKGNEGELLAALAATRGVATRVRFAGYIDDEALAQLYAECRACVFPSRLEGFGIGVAEAMRAGAPVAIARGTGMDEVAAGSCVEFDPSDPEDCAAAVHRAVARGQAELGAARERASAFAWDASAAELVRVWRSAALEGVACT
jgi:alpha-1,3-rhamnosyl/mannosyltransferase